MANDTLRIGDRDVPLAEIEEQAARPSYRWPPPHEGCAVIILALVAEVRRLRAVEEAALRVIAVAREREVSATGDLWKAIAQMSLGVDPLHETGGTDGE